MYFIEDSSGYKWRRVCGTAFLPPRNRRAPARLPAGASGRRLFFYDCISERWSTRRGGGTVENKSRSDILGKDAGVKGQTKGEETGCDTKASADVCSFP